MRNGLIVFLLLGGCAVTEDNFPDKYAKAACSKARQCDLDSWDVVYDEDMEACVDEVEDVASTVLSGALALGCDFDSKGAKKCLNAIRSASCDDVEEGDYGGECDDIVSDCLF